VAALAAALRCHWGSPTVMRVLFEALAAVAKADIGSTAAIEEHPGNVVAAAVSAIHTFPHDAGMVRACCSMLRAVRSAKTILEDRDGRGVCAIIEAAKKHADNPQLQDSVFRLFVMLFRDDTESVLRRASVDELVRVTVAALRMHGADRQVCQAANLTLQALAFRD
jgi:hypothetical protein